MENEILQLGGPHLKECKCCGIQFYGRRNQKFLNTTHKANHNNEKAAKRNQKLNPTIKRLKTSFIVLENLAKKDLLDQWLNITDLIKQGFDPNIPTNLIKTKKDGTEYFKLLDYAFRTSDDGTKIIIHKLKS